MVINELFPHGATVDGVAVSSATNQITGAVNGLTLNGGLYEPLQFKRLIHGIHGNSKRMFPFTHGNKVVGAFCNPANPLSKAPICDPVTAPAMPANMLDSAARFCRFERERSESNLTFVPRPL